MTGATELHALLGEGDIAQAMLDIAKAPFTNRQAECAGAIAYCEKSFPCKNETEWRELLRDACMCFDVHPVGVLSALFKNHPDVQVFLSPRPRSLKPFVRCADPSFTEEQKAKVDVAVLMLREYAARGDLHPPDDFIEPDVPGWVTAAVWWELTHDA